MAELTPGQKRAKSLLKRFGPDYYHKLGKKGGTKSRGGGFAHNPELAREAGRKGGLANSEKYGKIGLLKRMGRDQLSGK